MTSTWIDGTGSWEEPTNWNHVGDPGADFPNNDTLTYDAVVDSGEAQLQENNIAIDGLTLDGGTISTAASVGGFQLMDVADNFDFSSGAIGNVLLTLEPGVTGTWSGGTIQDLAQVFN